MALTPARPDADLAAVDPGYENEVFIRRALSLSRRFQREQDARYSPTGAVLVAGGKVLGEGTGSVDLHHDPTAHAATLAIRQAALLAGTEALTGAVIYTTHRPCAMCRAAASMSGVSGFVFATGSPDAAERVGAVELIHLGGRHQDSADAVAEDWRVLSSR